MDHKLDWAEGRASGIQVEYINPGGPVIRQCKLSLVRRLSNKMMSRAALYTYKKEYSLEILIIVETFLKGLWEVWDSRLCSETSVDKLEVYFDCPCTPCEYSRVRAMFFANAQGYGTPHRELLITEGTWNNWGRDDGMDEQRFVPLDDFYDGVELPPLEEQEYFEEQPTTFFKFRESPDR